MKSKQKGKTVTRSAARRGRARREKRTYSLSAESAAFIHALAQRAQLSASEALDQLLQQTRREEEKAHLEAQITAYYDHLSPAEVEEDRAWGKLGEAALASIAEEDELRSEAPLARANNRK